jgi:uncharacterized protein YgfB (UPF0149 family)
VIACRCTLPAATHVTNETATTIPDYDALSDSLSRAGAVPTLAELHGGVCGALCAGGPQAAASWLTDCTADLDPAVRGELTGSLTAMIEGSLGVLESRELEFEPLLPSDDTPLDEQVHALAVWCHGFVAGLGASAPQLTRGSRPGSADGTLAEVISDFIEISRAGLSEAEAAGRDQPDFALAQLREYVRAGVQIVFEDLAAPRMAAREHTEPGEVH